MALWCHSSELIAYIERSRTTKHQAQSTVGIRVSVDVLCALHDCALGIFTVTSYLGVSITHPTPRSKYHRSSRKRCYTLSPASFTQRSDIAMSHTLLTTELCTATTGTVHSWPMLSVWHRWAIAPQYIEHFGIVLSIFQVSSPTIQRGCPTMLFEQGRGQEGPCLHG